MCVCSRVCRCVCMCLLGCFVQGHAAKSIQAHTLHKRSQQDKCIHAQHKHHKTFTCTRRTSMTTLLALRSCNIGLEDVHDCFSTWRRETRPMTQNKNDKYWSTCCGHLCFHSRSAPASAVCSQLSSAFFWLLVYIYDAGCTERS